MLKSAWMQSYCASVNETSALRLLNISQSASMLYHDGQEPPNTIGFCTRKSHPHCGFNLKYLKQNLIISKWQLWHNSSRCRRALSLPLSVSGLTNPIFPQFSRCSRCLDSIVLFSWHHVWRENFVFLFNIFTVLQIQLVEDFYWNSVSAACRMSIIRAESTVNWCSQILAPLAGIMTMYTLFNIKPHQLSI